MPTGIKKVKWDVEMDNIIRQNFSTTPAIGMPPLLPGLTYKQISGRARRLGVPSYKAQRRLDIRHDFFGDVNVVSSYWAGFIAADGCIVDNTLVLDLATKDIIQLAKLNGRLNLQHKFKVLRVKNTGLVAGRKKSYTHVRLTVASTQILKDLYDNFMITPRKTKTLQPPDLTGDCALAYIAGYIDGDGSIVYSNGNFSFSVIGCSKPLLTWIADCLRENEPLTSKQAKVTMICEGKCSVPFYRVFLGGKAALSLCNKMYSLLNYEVLVRKWFKGVEAINDIWLKQNPGQQYGGFEVTTPEAPTAIRDVPASSE